VTALLEVEDLHVRFRTAGPVRAALSGINNPFLDAVLDVSFVIAPGTTFALVGESGSGKTTLARALTGLVAIRSGRIRFAGVDLPRNAAALSRWRRDVAMMFQDPVASLSPRYTVKSLLAEPFRIHGEGGRDLDGEVRRLLGLVGLHPDFAGRYPHQLSGGQARRVCVARSLALSPKLIIADEPTAGLDVSVQGEILNLMARLQRELGLAYLIITHNLAITRHVSDTMAIMYMGRFVETGPTSAIFERPAHPYTHGLLAAQPHPDPDRRREHVELEGEVPSLLRRPAGCEFHTRCPHRQALCEATPPEPLNIAARHTARCHFPLVAPPSSPTLPLKGGGGQLVKRKPLYPPP
jgi:oligopeptide/dipeptide ABC transporter ATP-binding protein